MIARLALSLLLTAALAGTARADLLDVLAPGSRSAPGLGGDPFASPVQGPRGWWAMTAGRGSGEGLAFESSQPLLRGAGAVELRRDEWRAFAAESFRFRERALQLAVARREPDWNASFEGTPVSASAAAARAGVGVGVRVEPVLPGLALAATLPAWSDRRQPEAMPAGIGARVATGGGLVAQLAWTRSREAQQLLLTSAGDRVATGTDVRLDGLSAECEAAAGSWLAAELAIHRRWFAPKDRGAGAGYDFGPVGTAEQWQTGVTVRPSRGCACSCATPWEASTPRPTRDSTACASAGSATCAAASSRGSAPPNGALRAPAGSPTSNA
jgi:hypothetical protein